jgi:outer membrane lipoprotein-sorting protein
MYNEMKRLISFVLTLLLTLSLSAASQEQMIKNIASLCAKISETTSAFSEERSNPRKPKQTLQGTLTYRSDNYLSMEYTVDTDKFLIEKGQMLNRREGKTMKYDLSKNLPMRNLSNTLLYSFSGQLEKLSKEQNTTLQVKEQGDYYVVVLDAVKKQARGYSHIEITYLKKNGKLIEMKMDEFNGLSTLYRLVK